MTSRFAQLADVETGNSANIPMRNAQTRRGKRRLANSLPVGLALSFSSVFLFFVLLGMLRANDIRRANEARKSTMNPLDSINTGQPNLFTYNIVAEFDHDPNAFTQGFEVLRDESSQKSSKLSPNGKEMPPTFIESTGLRGHSTVREVDITSGEVLRSTVLVDEDFGEGITRLGNKLYQVTWQGPKMIAYNVEDFTKKVEMSTHLKDGWGITNDGTNLIVGDSTNTLYYINPNTSKTVKHIDVTDNGKPITWLNELEWVDGLIYANIWQRECIAQIEPNTGSVVGWVDLSGITDKVKVHSPDKRVDVLNGIAWDGVDGKLYITGKFWPKVYQIELRPLYFDSKNTDVDKMTADIRRRCIIS